jgi:hypothetical protein
MCKKKKCKKKKKKKKLYILSRTDPKQTKKDRTLLPYCGLIIAIKNKLIIINDDPIRFDGYIKIMHNGPCHPIVKDMRLVLNLVHNIIMMQIHFSIH